MQLVATTSLQASRPSWSTIAWKTWRRFFKRSAMKAATCLRRPMTQSTGSSGGSWIRKATRLNSGNHQPGNNLRHVAANTVDGCQRKESVFADKEIYKLVTL